MTMVDLKVVVVGVSSWLISMLSLLTLLHLVFLVSVLQRSRQHLHSEGKHVRQCESWTVLVLRLYLLVPGAGIKGHNCSGEQPVFFLPPCDLSFWEGERGCPKSGGEPPEREGGGKGGGGCCLTGASSLGSEEVKGSLGRQWHVTLGSATPHPPPHFTPAVHAWDGHKIRGSELEISRCHLCGIKAFTVKCYPCHQYGRNRSFHGKKEK